MTKAGTHSLVILLVTGLVGSTLLLAQSKPAASQGVIQTQEANAKGVVAELTECRRKEGVLTIKVRFRNTSNGKTKLELIKHRNYDKFYVTAASKKYFILTDSEKVPLTNQATSYDGNLEVNLPPGQSFQWWAKYPAPPSDVKSVNLMMPIVPPFEDVPITDP